MKEQHDTYQAIAGMIDHALLKPTLTDQQLRDGCMKCRTYAVASACVNPHFVSQCAQLLADSKTVTSTVIGFPHGTAATTSKLAEAEQALADGAEELDAVVNIGKVLSGEWDYVRQELQRLTEVCHQRGKILKVIFENCYLNDPQKIELCRVSTEAEADFVKTSTGYGTGGATIEDLMLMVRNTPETMGIKAAGGIKTLQQILEMKALGVTRIGTSNSFAILDSCVTPG